MINLIKTGRIFFAMGLAGLAIISILSKDFIVGRPPAWPPGFSLNPMLGYISASLLLLAALCLIFQKKAGWAALFIALLMLFLSIAREIPQFMNNWLNTYKSMALFGGALIVACSYYTPGVPAYPAFMTGPTIGKNFILLGSILLAIFFIAGGYAHFKFSDFVKDFIPAYLPFHAFWTYFCGIALVAGGLGMIFPQTRKPAALLSGIMVLGWFLLLHIPRFFADMSNQSDRMGLCESFAFAGIFFVLFGILQRKS